jgi:hypothetical protein
MLKTETINGVPFDVDEKGNVFLYSKDKKTTPCIGKVDKEKNLTLLEDWQTTQEIIKWLAEYRTGLAADTTAAIEKAREQQLA